MTRTRVFFDLSVDNVAAGRVIFELFNDFVPTTCENFRALCTGEKGLSASGNPLYYKNSIIHRSIKGFMVQGGDFTKRNGSGGESIYGGQFSDEDLSRPVDAEGLLCMANKGANTNGSQFFVTLRECSHLNGKHVVFGKVIRGYEVIQKIAEVPVDEKSRPMVPIIISNCGELELRKKPEAIEATRKKRLASVSDSEGRSRSPSPHSHPPQRHRKKSKQKKVRASSSSPTNKKDNVPREETEEEYDARLEREELQRLEDERKRELELIKRKYEQATQSRDGVRFKGRGRMKFIDPETNQQRGYR